MPRIFPVSLNFEHPFLKYANSCQAHRLLTLGIEQNPCKTGKNPHKENYQNFSEVPFSILNGFNFQKFRGGVNVFAVVAQTGYLILPSQLAIFFHPNIKVPLPMGRMTGRPSVISYTFWLHNRSSRSITSDPAYQ